ncbi:MAG: HEAT repeat domain-containing protein, partial [Desulfobacterales bacterium]|nr:HEAT repeat domain-containing protein [Desulfobacterales bacterium]
MKTTSMIGPKINQILDPVGDAIDKGIRDPSEIKWVFAIHDRYRTSADLAKLGEKAIDDMIDSARASNLDRRLCVLIALGEIGSKEATPFLVEKLRSEYWIERKFAAGALESIADPEALEALKQGLEKEEVARGAFFGAIIAVADDSTRELFVKALEEEEPDIRRAVMKSFAKTPGPEMLPILLDALHDKQMGVVFDAVKGLKLYGESIVDEIVEKLTAKGRYTRKAAVQFLGDIKSRQGVAPLCEQLALSKNKALREEIAWALGQIKDPGAAPALCKALADPATGVRENAAVALGKIGLPKTVPDLEKLLYSRDFFLDGMSKYNAVAAIGKIKAPIAIEALLKALRHDDDDIRVIAVSGLRKQKVIEAIPPIREMLETEKNERARKKYEKAVVALTRTKAARNRRKPKSKRAAIPKDPAVQLSSHDPSVRKKGIAAMKRAGNEENIPRLEPLLFDEDVQIRKNAALAIKKLGAGGVVPGLVRGLDAENGVRTPHVIEALGWLGGREHIEPLAKFLGSDASHLRRATKTALKRLKIDEAALQEKELEVLVHDAVKKEKYGQVPKLGAPAIPILQRIMADPMHPHLMTAVHFLHALDWRPRTLEEKVIYHAGRGPQEALDALASEGFELLKQLYIKGDKPRYVSKALASTGWEGVRVLLTGNPGHYGSLSDNPVTDALVEHGKNYIDRIIHFFEREDAAPEEKGYLAFTLASMGAREAVGPLMAFVKEELDNPSSRDEWPWFAAV